MADGPQRATGNQSHPLQRWHPLPVVTQDLPIFPPSSPTIFFYRGASSALLTRRQPMVEFYLLKLFSGFPLRNQNEKNHSGKNRTHESAIILEPSTLVKLRGYRHTHVYQIPHRTPPGLASHHRGAQRKRPDHRLTLDNRALEITGCVRALRRLCEREDFCGRGRSSE